MKDLVLIGGGGHCRSCIDVIEQQNAYRIVGIIDLPQNIGTEILGYPVIGCDDDLEQTIGRSPHFLLTLGQIKSPDRRIALYNRLRAFGGTPASVISPRAHVSRHARVEPGTIVMHQALINAGAQVGANCIINSCALIEHDAHIGDHCHISTAAVINGGVQVGSETFIGSNSVTRQEIHIGKKVIVGAGVTIMEDVPDASVYLGKKAR